MYRGPRTVELGKWRAREGFDAYSMRHHRNGVEIFRLTCIALEEDGIRICALVHDAILIEAPLKEIEEHVARTTKVMQKASEWVLGHSRQCRVDAEIVRWPHRYLDERGAHMWLFIHYRLGTKAA